MSVSSLLPFSQEVSYYQPTPPLSEEGSCLLPDLPFRRSSIPSSFVVPSLFILTRKFLSNYTNLVTEVFKIHSRQRLGHYINNLLIGTHILEIDGSLLYHIPYIYNIGFLYALICHGTTNSLSSLYKYGCHRKLPWFPTPCQIFMTSYSKTISLHNKWSKLQCTLFHLY